MKASSFPSIVLLLCGLSCLSFSEEPPMTWVFAEFPEAIQLDDTAWDILKIIATSPNQKRSDLKIGGKLSYFSRDKFRNSVLSENVGPVDWADRSMEQQWMVWFPEATPGSFHIRETNYSFVSNEEHFAQWAVDTWNLPTAYAGDILWGNDDLSNNTIAVTTGVFDLDYSLAQIQTIDIPNTLDHYITILPDGTVWEPEWNLVQRLNEYMFRGLGLLTEIEPRNFSSPWFGGFKIMQNGWIIHEQLGRLYADENSFGSSKGYWFYHEQLGWLWTLPNLYPVFWSDQLEDKVLIENLSDILLVMTVTEDPDISMVLAEREEADFEWTIPETIHSQKPKVIHMSDDDWDLVRNIGGRSIDERESLYFSGYLMEFAKQKSQNMAMSGHVGYNDHLGKSFSLQLDQIIPDYDDSAAILVGSYAWDDFYWSLYGDWSENEKNLSLIKGVDHPDSSLEYSELNYFGGAITQSKYGYYTGDVIYGETSLVGDPYFIFLPDGMFWIPLADFLEENELPHHGGLGFLHSDEEGWWNSPWFGRFKVHDGAWINHESLGLLYIYGGMSGESKGQRFYKEGIGWIWTIRSCMPYFYLQDKGWHKLEFDIEGSYFRNLYTQEIIRITLPVEVTPD